MDAGTLMREARLRAGLTQTALSHRLGVPQSTVARWETGRVSPSFENVIRTIRACDLDVHLRIVERDPQLEALVDEHLLMTPRERLEQNNQLVTFVNAARARIASDHA
jgi:transcriptional regulator with XRE-family HTH domain